MALRDIIGRIRAKLFTGGVSNNPPPSSTEQREPDSADDWIYGKTWLFVGSTDVSEAMYDIEESRLWIIFINDKRKPDKSNVGYYSDVDEQVAREFYNTGSPGRKIWSLRSQNYAWTYVQGVDVPTGGQRQVIRQVSPSEPF